MRKIFGKKTNHSGFTLAEVLVTIAILAILGGVVAVSASTMIKNSRQKTLDKMAETIYIVAERNLQSAALSGKGSTLGAESTTPYNVDSRASTSDQAKLVLPENSVSQEIYGGKWLVRYMVGKESYHVLDAYCTTADNTYASSFSFDNTETLINEHNSKSGKVGYYGGGGIDTLPDTSTLKHDRIYAALNIENDEELGVMIYVKLPDAASNPIFYSGNVNDPKETKYTLEITGVTSGNKIKIERTLNDEKSYASKYADKSKTCYNKMSLTFGEFIDYIALDNLQYAPFKKLATGAAFNSNLDSVSYFKSTGEYATTEKDYIVPGEDIVVTVSAECEGEKSAQFSDASGTKTIGESSLEFAWAQSAQTNSLFAARAEGESSNPDTVEIAYGRHLQNLDATTSGIPSSAGNFTIAAIQTKNLDFAAKDGRYNENWAQLYNASTKVNFTPIVNYSLAKYDGGIDSNTSASHYIKGLKITKTNEDPRGVIGGTSSKDMAGMFGVFFGNEISNVNFKNCDIDTTSSSFVEAGLLAGRTSEVDIVQITNCLIEESTISNKRNTVDTNAYGITGGFVGVSRRGISFDKCQIKNSTVTSTDQSWYTGGFVGATSERGTVASTTNTYKVEIKNCLVDTCTIHNRQSKAGSSAGGYIGYVNSNEITISDSYVVDSSISAYVGGNSSVVGGLVGWFMVKTEATLTNCGVYTTLPENKALNQFFIESTGNSGGTNVGGGLLACAIYKKLTIENCFAAMKVNVASNNGTRPVGGLIGGVYSSFGGISYSGPVSIKNSYADCYMHGTKAGGLIGTYEYTQVPYFENCYSAGCIDGNKTTIAAGIVPAKASIKNCYSLFNFDNVLDSTKFVSSELTYDSDGYVSSYPSDAAPANESMKKYALAMDKSSVVNSFYTYGGEVEEQTNIGEYKSIKDIVEKPGIGKKTGSVNILVLGADTSTGAKNAYEFAGAFGGKLKGDDAGKSVIPNIISTLPHYGDWVERPGNQLWARIYQRTSDNKYVMYFETGSKKSVIPGTSTALTLVGEWLADDGRDEISTDSGFLKQTDDNSEAAAKLVAPWQYSNSSNEKYGWKGTNNSNVATILQNVVSVTFDEAFCKDTKVSPAVSLAKPLSTRNWFKNFRTLNSLNGIKNLDVSSVTSMKKMFFNCYKMPSYDISTWVTSTELNDISFMFGNANTDINSDGTDATIKSSDSRATATSIIFGSGFDTTSVENMKGMFMGQDGVTNLDLSMFKTESVTDFSYFGPFCTRLTSITGLSEFNVKKVTTLRCMFYGCTQIQSLDFSKWDTSDGKLTDLRGLIGGNAGKATTSIKFGELFNTQNVDTMAWAFEGLSNITKLDLTMFNTSSVTDFEGMFSGCSKLKTIYASVNFVTDATDNSSGMFDNCNVLVGGCGTAWSSKSGSSKTDRTYAWIDGRSGNPYAGGSSEGYFTNIRNQLFARIYKINDNPDYELIFEAGSAQSGKKLIEEYPGSMFLIEREGYPLTRGEVQDWVAYAPWHGPWTMGNPESNSVRENIVRASFTDEFCENAKPVTMRNWFANMYRLKSVDFNDLDTSAVVNMMGTFSSLPESRTNELTSLDLTVFDTSSLQRTDCMFRDCKNLQTIRVSDEFDASGVTGSSQMFLNCENLVGGCGTAWSDHSSGNVRVDRKYAWIDGKSGNPNDGGSTLGYFTSEEFDGLHARIYERSNGDYYMYFEMGSVSQHEGGGTLVAEWKGDGPNGFLNKLASDENSKAAAPWYQSSKGDWSYASGRNKIKKVIFREAYCDRAQPRALRNYFIGMENLTDIEGISTLDVSKVQYANGAFAECYSLEELDLSEWNTSSLAYPKVMFRNCNKLRTIFATTDFTVASVVDGSGMFENCQVLVGGNGTAWADQSGAAKTNKTYAWVDGVENNINTGDTKGYFTLPVLYARVYKDSSNNYVLVFEAGYAKSKYGTFVEGLEWEGSATNGFLNTTNTPWRTSGGGYNYSNVKKVIFDKNFTQSNKARPICLAHWFSGFSSLQTIEGLENLDARNVTTMEDMFLDCWALTGTLDFSKWSTPKLVNMSRTFYSYSSGLKVSNIIFGENFDVSNVTTMWALFGRCRKIETLDLSNWNTSKVGNMQYMFVCMTDLKTIFVSDKYTIKGGCNTSMMFEYQGDNPTKLVGGSGTKFTVAHGNGEYARIDRKSNDPSFGGYFTLKTPAVYARVYDVSGQNVLRFEKYPQGDTIFSEGTIKQGALLTTNADGTFDGEVTWDGQMSNIKSVEVNTPIKPAKTDNWFKNATVLTSVDFKYNTGTGSTTSMESMFEGCTAIAEIDIRNLNVSSVTSFNNMFKDCTSLRTIFARKNFATEAASGATGTGMFTGCTHPLTGAVGTTYDGSHDGIDYAHVDEAGSPGYFTLGEVYEPDSNHAGISHVTITPPGGGPDTEAWYYNGVFYNTEAEAIAAWQNDHP